MRPSESNNSKTPQHDDMHLWLCDKDNQTYLIRSVAEKEPRLKELSEPKPYDGHKLGDRDYDFNTEIMTEVSGFSTDSNIEQLEIEVPVYTGYNSSYLQGICDAILTWNSNRIRLYKIYKLVHNKDGNGEIKSDDAPKVFCPTCYEKKCNENAAKFRGEKFETLAKNESYHRKTYDIDKSVPIRYGSTHTRVGYSGLIIEFKPKLTSISGVIGQIKTYRDSFKNRGKYQSCKLYPVIITYDQNTKYDSILENQGIYIIRIKTLEEYLNQKELQNLTVLTEEGLNGQ
jgi:hypothetical protein